MQRLQVTLSLRAAPVGSELAVNLVGLADQNQSDGGGNHDDQTTPEEAAQKIGKGGGHGWCRLVKAEAILRIEACFLRC